MVASCYTGLLFTFHAEPDSNWTGPACFLKRMLSRSVPDMTQGCCGTYAREPWILTVPQVPRSSPRTAARRDDLPAASSPS